MLVMEAGVGRHLGKGEEGLIPVTRMVPGRNYTSVPVKGFKQFRGDFFFIFSF